MCGLPDPAVCDTKVLLDKEKSAFPSPAPVHCSAIAGFDDSQGQGLSATHVACLDSVLMKADLDFDRSLNNSELSIGLYLPFHSSGEKYAATSR